MSRFDGKVALVTGAGGGVGRAVALGLGSEGAAVAAVGRDAGRLRTTVADVERAGGRASAIVADVRSDADVRAAVGAAVEAYGGLDLLAHTAGTLRMGALPELQEQEWDLVFDTNAKSCFLLARHAVPAMRASGGGAIVNVASVFADAAVAGAAAYAASKAAVVALSRTMALDHVREGIRVNCVSPGSMRTPMLIASAQELSPEDPEAALAAIGRRHPIERLIDPAEVADLVLYLLSDAASAIVGATYAIDGGRLAQLGSADRGAG